MFLKSNTISINELFSLCFCVHDEQPGSVDRTVVTFCILLWMEFQNFEKWRLKIRLYKLTNKCFPQAVTYAAERSTLICCDFFFSYAKAILKYKAKFYLIQYLNLWLRYMSLHNFIQKCSIWLSQLCLKTALNTFKSVVIFCKNYLM